MNEADRLQLYAIQQHITMKIEKLEEQYKTASGGMKMIITKHIKYLKGELDENQKR